MHQSAKKREQAMLLGGVAAPHLAILVAANKQLAGVMLPSHN